MTDTAETSPAVETLDTIVDASLAREGPVRLTGLRGSARSVVAARLVRAHAGRPVLVVTPDSRSADTWLEDLQFTLGEEGPGGRIRSFPRHDVHPYERFSPQPFVVAQRMDVLYRWLVAGTGGNGAAPVVVAPWTALAQYVPSRETVRGKSVHLEVGQVLDRDALVTVLVSAGYQRMALVEERGEIAVRGHVLDLFPPQRERPIRIELIGDEVEQIREFDPASQRSEGSVSYAVAPPPRELLFDRSLIIDRSETIRQHAGEQGVAAAAVDELINALLRGHLPPGIEAPAPLRARPARDALLDDVDDDAENPHGRVPGGQGDDPGGGAPADPLTPVNPAVIDQNCTTGAQNFKTIQVFFPKS